MCANVAGAHAAITTSQLNAYDRSCDLLEHGRSAVIGFRIRDMPRATDRTRKSEDIREQPAYQLAEAARYLKVAPTTLRS